MLKFIHGVVSDLSLAKISLCSRHVCKFIGVCGTFDQDEEAFPGLLCGADLVACLMCACVHGLEHWAGVMCECRLGRLPTVYMRTWIGEWVGTLRGCDV